MLKLTDDREKRAIEMMRRALISEGCVRLFADSPEDEFAEVRFTDARLAAYKSDLTFAAFGSLPQRQQLVQFLVAADKPCNLVRVLCFEAARCRSFPRHTAGVDRLGHPDEYVWLAEHE
jgi:hypothetical protein